MNCKKGTEHYPPLDARILRLVLQRPGTVRVEVAEILNVSPAGAAVAVRSLMRQGALVQWGAAPSSGGRPAVQLHVAPDLATAFSHAVTSDGLKSALVNADGEIINSVVTSLKGADSVADALSIAEATLSSAANGTPKVGAVLVLPGSPHPESHSVGKAPWLFGYKEVDVRNRVPDIHVITNAEALLRAESARHPALLRDLTLAVDLNDGACATIATPEGSRVHLNLMALDAPDFVFVKERLVERIREASLRPDTSLSLHLARAINAESALWKAEDEGDVVASKLVDEIAEGLASFVALLARMVRPANLVVASRLFGTGLARADEFRRLVERRCPAGVVAHLSVIIAEAQEWDNVVGGGLTAIDRWLHHLEQ